MPLESLEGHVTKHQRSGDCVLVDNGHAGPVPGWPYPNERAYQRDGVCSGVTSVPHGLCTRHTNDYTGRGGNI